MKLSNLFLPVCLSLGILAGCGEGEDETTTTSAASSAVTCNDAAAQVEGPQPDKSSIENLFGCVTFSHVSSDGENKFEKSVVFSAESEGDVIVGGRTVRGESGSSLVMCAELAFGQADFLCLISGLFNNNDKYVITMDSQFKGSGTHQFCIGTAGCQGDAPEGFESPENDATMTIVRNNAVATSETTLNGLPISAIEAADFKMADALQFSTVKQADNTQTNLAHQAFLLQVEEALQATIAE